MRNTFGLLVCACGLIARSLPGQHAASLQEVHKVYLSIAPNKPALTLLRKQLSRELTKTGKLTVVDEPASADAVLFADGDIFVKAYISLNARSGTYTSRGEPIRGGFLSLELKDKDRNPLWSYLVTPRLGSAHIEQDLARQGAREVLEAIRDAKPPKPETPN